MGIGGAPALRGRAMDCAVFERLRPWAGVCASERLIVKIIQVVVDVGVYCMR